MKQDFPSKSKKSGTGIKAEGRVDMEMTNITFKDNNKDMDLIVEQGSKITIDELISTGCKTESLAYSEYTGKISSVKEFLNSSTDYFIDEQIEKNNFCQVK